ncbi:MAG: GGDEF domain-containing protein [Pseudomonadota bacterium]
MSSHATFAEVIINEGTLDASKPVEEVYRQSLEKLSSQFDVSEPKSSALLLSRALELVSEAEQMLAAQRARIVQLERLSVTDELTELYNRRGFLSQFQRQLSLARRHGETGVLAMLDLDDFKMINDQYGHPVGDRALVAVATKLRSILRQSDIIARLGGDEFAVGLTRCSVDGGMEQISRIEAEIGKLQLVEHDRYLPLTASIGAAPYDGKQTLDEVIAVADAALYEAKRKRKT